MYNDKFEQNNNKEQPQFFNQQFNPDGFRTPPPPPPNMGGQPPSAPPRFTPEMPSMREQPFSGAPDSGAQFRGGGQNQPRNYRRCLNRFTYIWLINGNNFWFYPTFVGWQQIEGFRWRNGRWDYDRINLRRILFLSCF